MEGEEWGGLRMRVPTHTPFVFHPHGMYWNGRQL